MEQVTPDTPDTPTMRDQLLDAFDAVLPYIDDRDNRTRVLNDLVDRALPIIRVGADDTPLPENVVPTPGQLIARFVDGDAEHRLRWAHWMLNSAEEAQRCFQMDHEGAVEYRAEMRQISARLGVTEAAARDAHTATAGTSSRPMASDPRPLQAAIRAFYAGAGDADMLSYNPIIGFAMARAIEAAAHCANLRAPGQAAVEHTRVEHTERTAEGPGQT